MQIRSARSLSAADADTVLVGFHADRRPAAGTDDVVEAVGDWVDGALESVGFTGERGQTALLTGAGVRLVAVGVGEEVDAEGLRQAAASGLRAADPARSVATTLHQLDLEGAEEAVVEGLGMAGYRFDRYRSSEAPDELAVELIGAGRGWQKAADRARVVVEAVGYARDLVNRAPGEKSPLALAADAESAGKEAGLKTEVWSGKRLHTERMAGLLAVGAGSHAEPCLLRMEHKPRRAGEHLVLVGKGITFDSGGLSIKSNEQMQTMKTDMGGAAAVIAAAIAAARLDLQTRITVLAPLAENMPGGGAQRPGDVIRYRNGKTVEVLNTDAEGRLVMADALCLAAEEEPDLVVDVATLTGAAKVALGERIAGLWGRPDDAGERVRAAADAAGERVWPMPLPDDYRKLIDSEVADMKNTAGRYGGAIGAAMLLAEFVGDVPWAHLDIAGPAWSESVDHYIPKGGTGFGVRTLTELAKT